MEAFTIHLDLRRALSLYIFFRAHEEELEGAASELFARVRAYLYEHLSIEELERPDEALERLTLRN